MKQELIDKIFNILNESGLSAKEAGLLLQEVNNKIDDLVYKGIESREVMLLSDLSKEADA